MALVKIPHEDFSSNSETTLSDSGAERVERRTLDIISFRIIPMISFRFVLSIHLMRLPSPEWYYHTSLQQGPSFWLVLYFPHSSRSSQHWPAFPSYSLLESSGRCMGLDAHPQPAPGPLRSPLLVECCRDRQDPGLLPRLRSMSGRRSASAMKGKERGL